MISSVNSMSSNVSTKMALFLVEDHAVKDVIGRNALIPQEIFGRAQVNDDKPYEISPVQMARETYCHGWKTEKHTQINKEAVI